MAGLFPCCQDAGNRELVELRTADDTDRLARWPWISRVLVAQGWLRHPQRPHVRIERCRACNRRHYRAYLGNLLQPGKVGIR